MLYFIWIQCWKTRSMPQMFHMFFLSSKIVKCKPWSLTWPVICKWNTTMCCYGFFSHFPSCSAIYLFSVCNLVSAYEVKKRKTTDLLASLFRWVCWLVWMLTSLSHRLSLSLSHTPTNSQRYSYVTAHESYVRWFWCCYMGRGVCVCSSDEKSELLRLPFTYSPCHHSRTQMRWVPPMK